MLTLFENFRPIFIEALLSILRFQWINFDLLNWPRGRKLEIGRRGEKNGRISSSRNEIENGHDR